MEIFRGCNRVRVIGTGDVVVSACDVCESRRSEVAFYMDTHGEEVLPHFVGVCCGCGEETELEAGFTPSPSDTDAPRAKRMTAKRSPKKPREVREPFYDDDYPDRDYCADLDWEATGEQVPA